MRMKTTGKLIMGSLFFAALACGLLYWYLEQERVDAAMAAALEDVVTMKKAVAANEQIQAEDIVIKQMPKKYIPPSACISASQAIGKTAAVPLTAGEILLKEHLIQDENGGGLALLIPEGKRAMTVAVDAVTGVSSLIRPGDHVDVLYFLGKEGIGNPTEGTLLQDKLVLAVDQTLQGANTADGEKDGDEETQTVTLAVSPEEAQYLGLAQDVGSIRLILRPQGDASRYTGKGITLQNIAGQ